MESHSRILGWRIPWIEEPAVHRDAKRQTQLKRIGMHTRDGHVMYSLFSIKLWLSDS